MSTVEDRLAAFRARKKVDEQRNLTTTSQQTGSMTSYVYVPPALKQNSAPKDSLSFQEEGETEELIVSELDETYSDEATKGDLYFRIALAVLKICLWASLWFLFINLGFGAVFFIISAFYFICTNLRTRPKLKNEPSAYSVFNPNCEPIEGTVNAEDLQRQMLFVG